MKKLLLIFIFLSTINCAQNADKNKKSDNFLCPNIYFSSQNNSFVRLDDNSTDSSLKNIFYKAKFNNYAFNEKCSNKDKIKKFPIDLLITIELFDLNESSIELPIFAFLYDKNQNILDKQYFLIKKKTKYNPENSSNDINEIIDRLNIATKVESEISTIVIGFINLNN